MQAKETSQTPHDNTCDIFLPPSVDQLCLAETLEAKHLVIRLQGGVADLSLGRGKLADNRTSLVHCLVLVQLVDAHLLKWQKHSIKPCFTTQLCSWVCSMSPYTIQTLVKPHLGFARFCLQVPHACRYSVGLARPRGSKPLSPGREPSNQAGLSVLGSQRASPASTCTRNNIWEDNTT